MLNDYQMAFLSMEMVYIVVVSFLAFKTNKNIGRMGEIRHFRTMQMLFLIEACAQIFWVLGDARVIQIGIGGNWVVNMTYSIAFAMCMYQWQRFIAEKVRYQKNSRLAFYTIHIQTVVVIIHIILLLTSVWTKWIFYVDSTGTYMRGNMFWMNICCCYSHWISTTLLIFVYRSNAERMVRYQLNQFMISSILPLVGGILQLFAYNIPFLESTVMLGILFMFNILQEEQIKTDALTGLNNRAQFNATYEKMLNQADVAPFLIFVTDIDGFKKINDTYGHLAGDQALVMTAKQLKQLERKYSSLQVYRYGGDEFVMLVLEKDIPNADQFQIEINKMLSQAQHENGLGFTVHFSIGYQEIVSKDTDALKAFGNADNMLYRVKNERKQKHIQNK